MRRLVSLVMLMAAWPGLGALGGDGPASRCVIISGLGGGGGYDALFAGWASRLREVLGREAGMECRVLSAEGKGAEESRIESIRGVFSELSAQGSPGSDLYVFLIGHGSFLKGEAKLLLPGPDLSATELGRLVEGVPSRRTVIINGASASAPFINALSAPGRIIVTAAKSAEEKNATQFMGQFIAALEDGAADQNRDEQISVLEAAAQASSLTDAWYASKGWLTTEHALLDDNGDGRGTRPVEITAGAADAVAEGSAANDGLLAAECMLIHRALRPQAPQGLVMRYEAALAEIERFKKRKGSMETDAYFDRLEELLVKAARINRELRGGEPPTAGR